MPSSSDKSLKGCSRSMLACLIHPIGRRTQFAAVGQSRVPAAVLALKFGPPDCHHPSPALFSLQPMASSGGAGRRVLDFWRQSIDMRDEVSVDPGNKS
jgi:hypothetical protein